MSLVIMLEGKITTLMEETFTGGKSRVVLVLAEIGKVYSHEIFLTYVVKHLCNQILIFHVTVLY